MLSEKHSKKQTWFTENLSILDEHNNSHYNPMSNMICFPYFSGHVLNFLQCQK
jgi:hypothetical protein